MSGQTTDAINYVTSIFAWSADWVLVSDVRGLLGAILRYSKPYAQKASAGPAVGGCNSCGLQFSHPRLYARPLTPDLRPTLTRLLCVLQMVLQSHGLYRWPPLWRSCGLLQSSWLIDM